MKGRRYGHLHTSEGDAMVQLHRPSLSEMTLNYISPIQSLAIMARLLYYVFG